MLTQELYQQVEIVINVDDLAASLLETRV